MTFGEKLFKLRKEKGLSQEALAEKLHTSRQAISKWENGQGYPETEKLLMIGNIFGVSMDYLLKDSADPRGDKETGYYVSKEMAEGYLVSTHKVSKYMALGIFLIALSTIPYFIFKQDPSVYIIPTIILATFGIGMFVSVSFIEDSQYKVLKKESLFFDEKYHSELTARYALLKKKYGVINFIGMCLFVAGLLAFGIDRKYITSEFLVPYYPVCIGMISIGLYIITRTSIFLDAYKLLAKNEEYINSFSFKIRRKVRERVDKL
ncbi:helix-turn-helix transcriptional regulator [Ornithinibacillus massiliensis]|uniref:Helix-turn-helix transcriptional regulator n=1 Tax=Ornithinibacillus massiliensis TaxID=1944633 RepID=A0ABS5M8X0_9BACI|nr:helix-turn-helix transcriptional regulator [Ornithinibacillus massiliensis]MBS3678762.1 helix-turn-helix transcriptional regulator [Ornithinibacillus massiliensis]